MPKDNLLKEAIADAKAVKEAALANAMIVLKDSFRPQLTNMLTEELQKEDNLISEQVKLKSSEIGSGGVAAEDPGPKEPASNAKSSSEIDNPGQEIDTFGEGFGFQAEHPGDEEETDIEMDPRGGVDIQTGEEPQGIASAHDQPHEKGPEGMGGGPEGMGGPPQMSNSGAEDELDLEAIIRELEADLHQGEAVAFGGRDPYTQPDSHIRPEAFKHAEAGKDAQAGIQAETLEDKPDAGIFKDGSDRPSKDGVPSGKEVKPGQELKDDTYANDNGDKLDEDVDLDEIMREITAEDSVSESEEIANENAELKRDLREHREVIKLLRTRINEVTLLNSKLMYTTKLFRNFNLSESQKKKVVAQFDRATTLREAKIVFTVLAESFGGKPITKSPNAVARLTEGASRQVDSTKPKAAGIISEGTTQVGRMQKLAGIIKG